MHNACPSYTTTLPVYIVCMQLTGTTNLSDTDRWSMWAVIVLFGAGGLVHAKRVDDRHAWQGYMPRPHRVITP